MKKLLNQKRYKNYEGKKRYYLDLMSPQHQCETPYQPEANQPDYTCGLDCDMCEETFRTEDDLGRHRACVHMRCACSACDNTDKRPLDFHRCYN